MSESRTRLLVIHNPISGGRRRRRLEDALAVFAAAGVEATVVRTDGPEHAVTLAREAGEDIDAVVSAGGDGTAHEVANGLLARDGTPPALGLLPFGTANCLARELGIAGGPARAAHTLLTAPVRTLHPGVATFEGRTRHFLSMLGTGFDARVVDQLDRRLKRRIGASAYVVESLKLWSRGPVRPVRLSLDGMRDSAGQCVVMNGHYYGGFMRFAPASTVFRPALFACLFPSTDRPRVLRYCFWSVLERLDQLPDYRVVPVRRLTVTPDREDGPPDPVQADGETIGHLPVTVSPGRRTLPVLVGRDPRQERFGPPPLD